MAETTLAHLKVNKYTFAGSSPEITPPPEHASELVYADAPLDVSFLCEEKRFSPVCKIKLHVDQIIDRLKLLEDIARIYAVQQMTCFYTVRGAELFHTRGTHSEEVKEVALYLSKALKLSTRETVLMALASYAHDWGHTPFSHTGQEALEKVCANPEKFGIALPEKYRAKAFDHDRRSVELVESENVASVLGRSEYLKNLNITPQDVACVLADNIEDIELGGSDSATTHKNGVRRELFAKYRYLNYLVKQVCDRLAYLKDDYTGLNFPLKKTLGIELIRHQLASTIRIVPVREGKTEIKHIAFSEDAFMSHDSAGPLWHMQICRDLLFQEGGNHTAPVAQNQNVEREIIDALRRGPENGGFSIDQFVNMTDAQAMQYFSELGQDFLHKRVEHALAPIGGWSLADFTPAGQKYVGDGLMSEWLEDKLSTTRGGVLPPESFFVCVVPDFSKALEVRRVDAAGKLLPNTEVITAEVGPARRLLFVVADRNLKAETLAAAQRHLIKLVHDKQLDGEAIMPEPVVPMVDEVFQDRDPQLFNRVLKFPTTKLVDTELNFPPAWIQASGG